MSKMQEYIVIEAHEETKLILSNELYTTADLITAGGRLIVAKNADEAEAVYVAEHGGSINDLVSFIAWGEQDDG